MEIFNRCLYVVLGACLVGVGTGLWFHIASLAVDSGIVALAALSLGVTTEDVY